jgi:branched-subunit amino acid aminotransferase/4-amino-4-deoxychorismate lyase
MSDFISVNGQLIPYDDARLAPGDAGFLHGAGLFETMRAKNGVVFRLSEHLARIAASAQAHSISFSLGLPQLKELISDLLDANGLPDARLRLTISRGDLHEVTAENPEPATTLVISAAAFSAYPAELYERGMTVTISKYKQNPDSPLTGHKSTSYMDRLLALREAQLAKAGESLWFTPGNETAAEGSISNLFAVLADGTPATPPTSWKENARLCLPGITRGVVMKLAGNVSERLITINDLLAAKEVFLTNAIMGVMPVTHIEQHKVGDEKVGPVAKKLRAAYEETVTRECAG